MARIRKFCAYRRLERAYTRVSKFREKSYIRVTPNPKVVKFNTGSLNKEFTYKVHLVSKQDLNIRDNSLESARQTGNRLLEKKIGVINYALHIRVYPHHVLRENPLAAGAGADRMSTGMSHSFGKPIGIAARVKRGQQVITIDTDKPYIDNVKIALKRAASKLPLAYSVVVEEGSNKGKKK